LYSVVHVAEPELGELTGRHFPGRKPPFVAIKHPVHPYKSPIQNRFKTEIAKDN
jgi:hypothetical protein